MYGSYFSVLKITDGRGSKLLIVKRIFLCKQWLKEKEIYSILFYSILKDPLTYLSLTKIELSLVHSNIYKSRLSLLNGKYTSIKKRI
jgi:hypothetical protein